MGAMKRLFSLLLFLTVAFSCSTTYVAEVPAFLSSGRGMLLPTTIELSPGSSLLLNLSIDVGHDTEMSIRNAYAYAVNHTEKACTITVSFPPEIEKVDGPSAGAYLATVFTLLLLDAPELEALKRVVITGAVDEEGNVYPVGGLYEKAKAAVGEGKHTLIAPIATRLEAFLLDHVDGLTYYHVDTVKDILEALRGHGRPPAHLFEEYLAVKNMSTHSVDEMAPLYRDIRERYISLLPHVPEPYRAFYNKSLERADEVAELGYYYTAANDLFVKLSEMAAMKAYQEKETTAQLLERVKGCLESYERPPYTEEDFEWAAGSIIRYYRAKATYDAVKDADASSAFISLEMKSRLSDAYEWCMLAKAMADRVKGTPVDEGAFKPLADEMLERMEGEKVEGILHAALLEYEKGHYLTAAYLLGPALMEDAQVFDNESLWYRIYHSQAEYLEEEDLESYARVYGYLALKAAELMPTSQPNSLGEQSSTCVWEGVKEDAYKGILGVAFLFFLAFYVGWYYVSR